jgi:hypothetical protein
MKVEYEVIEGQHVRRLRTRITAENDEDRDLLGRLASAIDGASPHSRHHYWFISPPFDETPKVQLF